MTDCKLRYRMGINNLTYLLVKKHLAKINDLISKLENHIQSELLQSVKVTDPDSISKILSVSANKDLTMADITSKLESDAGGEPIDQDWLRRVTQNLAQLKNLRQMSLKY